MKFLKIGLLGLLVSLSAYVVFHFQTKEQMSFFKGDDPRIHYVGRFDFSENHSPKVWSPGANLSFDVYGSKAVITITDELKFGRTHNYLQLVVDGHSKRLKLKGSMNRIVLFSEKTAKYHHVFICKNTESAIGYIQIREIQCQKLLKCKHCKKSVMEFIGDSITCGNGADSSQCSFGEGTWYDYHNAYLSFGARLARKLQADWMLSSVSGIGMNQSCCGMKHTMPEVYQFIDFHVGSKKWNFKVKPTIVFITLGQNDGTKFMKQFSAKYLSFIKRLRKIYPKSWFICCTSPMADRTMKAKMQACIQDIVQIQTAKGDKKIRAFSYQGTYTAGYDNHPTVKQHEEMMLELKRFINSSNQMM